MSKPNIAPLPLELDEVDAWRLEAKSERARRAESIIADFNSDLAAVLNKYRVDLAGGDVIPSFEGRKIIRGKRP